LQIFFASFARQISAQAFRFAILERRALLGMEKLKADSSRAMLGVP
jgi:hypothetical protein